MESKSENVTSAPKSNGNPVDDEKEEGELSMDDVSSVEDTPIQRNHYNRYQSISRNFTRTIPNLSDSESKLNAGKENQRRHYYHHHHHYRNHRSQSPVYRKAINPFYSTLQEKNISKTIRPSDDLKEISSDTDIDMTLVGFSKKTLKKPKHKKKKHEPEPLSLSESELSDLGSSNLDTAYRHRKSLSKTHNTSKPLKKNISKTRSSTKHNRSSKLHNGIETPSPMQVPENVTNLLKRVKKHDPTNDSKSKSKSSSLRDKLNIENKNERTETTECRYKNNTVDNATSSIEKNNSVNNKTLLVEKENISLNICEKKIKQQTDSQIEESNQNKTSEQETNNYNFKEKSFSNKVFSHPDVDKTINSSLRDLDPEPLDASTNEEHQLPNFCIDENDEDMHLRMEALKSAIMKKHNTRVLKGSKKNKKLVNEKLRNIPSPNFIDDFPLLVEMCDPHSLESQQQKDSYFSEDMELDSDMDLSDLESPYSPSDEINSSELKPVISDVSSNSKVNYIQDSSKHKISNFNESRPYSPSDSTVYDPELPGVHFENDPAPLSSQPPLPAPPIPPFLTSQTMLLGCNVARNPFVEPLQFLSQTDKNYANSNQPSNLMMFTNNSQTLNFSKNTILTSTATASSNVPLLTSSLGNLPQMSQSKLINISSEIMDMETDLDGSPLVPMDVKNSNNFAEWQIAKNLSQPVFISDESKSDSIHAPVLCNINHNLIPDTVQRASNIQRILDPKKLQAKLSPVTNNEASFKKVDMQLVSPQPAVMRTNFVPIQIIPPTKQKVASSTAQIFNDENTNLRKRKADNLVSNLHEDQIKKIKNIETKIEDDKIVQNKESLDKSTNDDDEEELRELLIASLKKKNNTMSASCIEGTEKSEKIFRSKATKSKTNATVFEGLSPTSLESNSEPCYTREKLTSSPTTENFKEIKNNVKISNDAREAIISACNRIEQNNLIITFSDETESDSDNNENAMLDNTSGKTDIEKSVAEFLKSARQKHEAATAANNNVSVQKAPVNADSKHEPAKTAASNKKIPSIKKIPTNTNPNATKNTLTNSPVHIRFWHSSSKVNILDHLGDNDSEIKPSNVSTQKTTVTSVYSNPADIGNINSFPEKISVPVVSKNMNLAKNIEKVEKNVNSSTKNVEKVSNNISKPTIISQVESKNSKLSTVSSVSTKVSKTQTVANSISKTKTLISLKEVKKDLTPQALVTTPQVVKHLPASKQEEYRRLKLKLIEMERKKKLKASTDTSTKNSSIATPASSSRISTTTTTLPTTTASTIVTTRAAVTNASVTKSSITTNEASKPTVPINKQINKTPGEIITRTKIVHVPKPVSPRVANNSQNIASCNKQPDENTKSTDPQVQTKGTVQCKKLKILTREQISQKITQIQNKIKDKQVQMDDLNDSKAWNSPKKKKTENIESNLDEFKQTVSDEVQKLAVLPIDKQKSMLAKAEEDLVSERHTVLDKLTEISGFLRQWEIERDLKSLYSQDVKNLREQLRLAEMKIVQQQEKMNTLSPKISEFQTKINTGRKECFRLSKICNSIGHKIVGPEYKVPTAAAELLNNRLSEVVKHTVRLRKKKNSSETLQTGNYTEKSVKKSNKSINHSLNRKNLVSKKSNNVTVKTEESETEFIKNDDSGNSETEKITSNSDKSILNRSEISNSNALCEIDSQAESSTSDLKLKRKNIAKSYGNAKIRKVLNSKILNNSENSNKCSSSNDVTTTLNNHSEINGLSTIENGDLSVIKINTNEGENIASRESPQQISNITVECSNAVEKVDKNIESTTAKETTIISAKQVNADNISNLEKANDIEMNECSSDFVEVNSSCNNSKMSPHETNSSAIECLESEENSVSLSSNSANEFVTGGQVDLHLPKAVDALETEIETNLKKNCTSSKANIESNGEKSVEISDTVMNNSVVVPDPIELMINKPQSCTEKNVDVSLSQKNSVPGPSTKALCCDESSKLPIFSETVNSVGEKKYVFRPYESVLKHINLTSNMVNGILCPFELMGTCNDEECPNIHQSRKQ
ncbi:probable serine/threonine-protein kinase DDB_G0282963 isoform X2 [Trichogramma pretiosum]|uniref:probable serine/threonine-protein kinase DDB_G0282963 isoform X2 n=1 Tax=Trichogramma pretiosum TaxID=7493 RepID=UPI0006C96E4F|nr:probable serine/threonine-protein kinase DDB_G0282963 isoform X2 [Trichogramma pretiosum]